MINYNPKTHFYCSRCHIVKDRRAIGCAEDLEIWDEGEYLKETNVELCASCLTYLAENIRADFCDGCPKEMAK